MSKDPTPIEQFWLMQYCLAILGQNKTYILFSDFPPSSPSLSKNRSRATEGTDIYRRYKQIQHLEN